MTMKFCEITYKYKHETHVAVVRETKGWEVNYPWDVLNHIESLVSAGAVITNVINYCN